MRRSLTILCVLLAIAAGAVWYQFQGKTPEILVQNPSVHKSDGTSDSLDVYLTLENSGGPDALVSVESNIAESAIIVRPQGIETTPIPANSTPIFSSDGVYLRLSGVDPNLPEGALVPLVLNFQNAGSLAIKAKLSDSMTMAGMDHSMSNMDHSMHAAPATASITISPQTETSGWDLTLTTENFEFVPTTDDMVDVPGQGHAHLYLNGLKLMRMYGPKASIGALLPGTYTVMVSLNSNIHMPVLAHGEPVMAKQQLSVQ